MRSFDAVNYSLRPSKSIQRQLVFKAVANLAAHLNLNDLVFVGFGSIWFTDFTLAHKVLGIVDMISIEADEIGYKRSVFNAPYATIKVEHGLSSDVLPNLYLDPSLRGRPWIIWLDYDGMFSESTRDDIISVIENAPSNSILLSTFNGRDSMYGKANERPDRLRSLFGLNVPDELSKGACRDIRFLNLLADLALDLMRSHAADLARAGGFAAAFRLLYQDSTPMVTVGGILPDTTRARLVPALVAASTWCGRAAKPIIAPHLTIKEALALQKKLPCQAPLSRDDVQALGFDLGEDQLEAFQTYYRQYPSFAQIIS